MTFHQARLNVIEGPVVEPLTLPQMWLQLRLDPEGSPPSTPFDEQLLRLGQGARERMEQVLRRPLVQQTWKASYCRFPCDGYVWWSGNTLWSLPYEYDVRPRSLEIPGPNIIGDPTVMYYDTNNILQLFDHSNYMVHSDTQPTTIELYEGIWWPITYWRQNAVEVTYKAGYKPLDSEGSPTQPDFVGNIPKTIINAMLLMVELAFNEQTPDKQQQMQSAIDAMISSYRVYTW